MKGYVVALLVVVGVLAGFYGGYRIGQNNVSASTGTNSISKSNLGTGFQAGGGRGGGFGSACPSPGAPSPSPGTNAVASGTITDLTSNSLTITSTACEVKVVFGNSVQISKTITGTTGDLQDNITVTIVGTRQADGSIKASAIQIGGNRIGIRAGASPSPAG